MKFPTKQIDLGVLPANEPPPPEQHNHGMRHPMRKTYVDPSDIDTMCHELIRVKAEIDLLRKFEYQLRFALDDLSDSKNKTRRVIGERYEAKLVSPDDYWSQTVLRQCVERFPGLWDKYLRISQYAPNLREVAKLENATGYPELMEFRELLLCGRNPSDAPPSVTVTEIVQRQESEVRNG